MERTPGQRGAVGIGTVVAVVVLALGLVAGSWQVGSHDRAMAEEDTAAAVLAARATITDAANPPWYRLPWRRDARARDAADAVGELAGPELDALVAELETAGELESLFDALGRLEDAMRAETLASVGERVDLDTWRLLGTVTESIDPDPGLAVADVARDEMDQEDRDYYDALVYVPFEGPLMAQGLEDEHPVAASDFGQGSLGNCYLITAMLAVVYESPDLLASMFEENANGTYTVTFADETPVVVSPDLPVHPDHPGLLAFTQDVGGDAAPRTELYAPLLEKAYAQYRGGWGEIAGGWAAPTMTELVGGTYTTISDPTHVTLEQLRTWTSNGQPVTTGTMADPRDPAMGFGYPDGFPGAYADGRLVHQHAYVVRGVDQRANEILLINPWHPMNDPVRLTIDEFREAMWRVDVSTLRS